MTASQDRAKRLERSGGGAIPSLPLIALSGVSVPLAALSLPLVVMIPEHYANKLGLPLAAVATVFMFVRLLDVALDPVLGALIDGTRSRFGPYKPWLAASLPWLLAAVYLLFMARPGAGPAYLAVCVSAAFIGWSVASIAQLAMAADLGPRRSSRSKVYGWLQAAFLLGTVLVMGAPILLGRLGLAGGDATPVMGWVIITLLVPGVAFALWAGPQGGGTRLARPPRMWDAARLLARRGVLRLVLLDLLLGLGFGVASAVLVFFFTVSKHLPRTDVGLVLIVQMSVAMASAPLVASLTRRFEKRQVLGAAAVLAGLISLAFVALPPRSLALACLGMGAWGVCYAATTFLPRAMMADEGDRVRADTGAEHMGALFALLTASWKLGGALSVGLGFYALAAVGYRPALLGQNSAAALGGLNLVFAGPSALLFFLGAVLSFTHPSRDGRGDAPAAAGASGDVRTELGLAEAEGLARG